MKSIKQISTLFCLLISLSFFNLSSGFFDNFFADTEAFFAQQQKAMQQMHKSMQDQIETLHQNIPAQNKTSVTINDETQNQQITISVAGLKVTEQNELKADFDNNRLTVTIPAGTVVVDIQQIRANLSYVSVELRQAYSKTSQQNKQDLPQEQSQDQQTNQQNEESYFSFQNQQSYSRSIEGTIDIDKLKNLDDYIEYDPSTTQLTITLPIAGPKIIKNKKKRVSVKIVNKNQETTNASKAESVAISQNQTPPNSNLIEPIDGGLIDEK